MLFKKFLFFLLSLWCIVTGTFVLMHAIPGDPFIGERPLPDEVLKALHAHWGLDAPLLVQYGRYWLALVQGDLGRSIVYEGQTVVSLIGEAFPISARLGLQALVLAIVMGTFGGIVAALFRKSWVDRVTLAWTTLGVSIPNFVVASILQYWLAVRWHYLPVARWGGWEHTVLPTLALAILPTAFILRLIRASLSDALSQDYIRTALAKGLSVRAVVWKHGVLNALLPVVTYLGHVGAQILTGSFMIEKIFAIPGLGQWMIVSIGGRDYPMIAGLALFYGTLLVTIMFLIELITWTIDPRIKRSDAP
ncbi:MAG: hypothetical protein RL235_532 [Chlamydiota bacterium]|jgi:ABC-type dipeptide/oligopeptide/nickel transport system permease component